MNEQQNLALVRRGYDAFGRGDLATLLELFDENIEWTTPGPPELPTAGRRRGRAQVAQFFEALDTVFEIQEFEPHTFMADGDRVIVLGRERTRVKPTGITVDGEWAHVFEIRNGRIVRMQEYMDTAPVVAALASLPART